MIIDEIMRKFEYYLQKFFDGEIKDYCVGARYAYCLISAKDGREELGVSLVLYPDVFVEKQAKIPKVATLIDEYLEGNILTRTLLLSCINAISQYLFWNKLNKGKIKIEHYNIIEIAKRYAEPDSKIVIIGNMKPIVRALYEVSNVLVFERDPILRGKEAIPEYFEFRHLKDADIVIITGCTILNDTLDLILRYTKKKAKKIIVGPTAQLLPQILLDYVDVVGSLRITDIEGAIKTLKLGGGRWSITSYAEDYVVTKDQK